jgi:sulfonate dioxygenase
MGSHATTGTVTNTVGTSRNSKSQDENVQAPGISYDINLPYKQQSTEYVEQITSRTEFPSYLPAWEPDIWFDEVLPFEFNDPALRANPQKPNLLLPGVQIKHITPKMGTVLTGIKIEQLSPAAKDELALLIVERKIVVLRDQSSFLHSGPQYQQDFMTYYGKLSHQPISGSVKGHPAFHIIHRDGNEDEIAKFFEHKMTSTLWHQDVSYERQPPGYIMLGILACPDVGGDTVFADTVEAYKRLSKTFQGMIDELKAVHTSEKMIGYAKAAKGTVRSDPIDSIHPIIRVHPVTGERSIYLNAEFLKGMVGLKDQETEMILKFLIDHICMGHDFQARVQWEKGSVVMFDGRTTLHTATVDYDSRVQARHIFRLAAMTEKPIPIAEKYSHQNGNGHSNGHT